MTSLIMIDNDDDDAKHHWKSDDFLMMLWPLSLMMPPLDFWTYYKYIRVILPVLFTKQPESK